jgi:DNA-directed RNA polymerase subunit beta'
MAENDNLFDKKVVVDAGRFTTLQKAGQIVSLRKLKRRKLSIKRNDKKLVDSRDAVPATSNPVLTRYYKASLNR